MNNYKYKFCLVGTFYSKSIELVLNVCRNICTYTYKEGVYLHTHNMYSRTQVDEKTLNSKSVMLGLRGNKRNVATLNHFIIIYVSKSNQ